MEVKRVLDTAMAAQQRMLHLVENAAITRQRMVHSVVELALDVVLMQQRMVQPITQAAAQVVLLNERVSQVAADAWAMQQRMLHTIRPVLDMASESVSQVGAMWQAQREQLEKVVMPMANRVVAQYAELLERLQGAIIYLPFYLALQALQEGDKETVDLFLFEWCSVREPTLEMHGLLWEVLNEGRWRRAEKPGSYIKTAFWRKSKRLYCDNMLLSEDARIASLDAPAGKLWTPHLDADEKPLLMDLIPDDSSQEGYRKVEEQIFINQILDCVTPQDRRALLAYYLGQVKTLREAFGGKDAADVGRRRLRQLSEKLRPYLVD